MEYQNQITNHFVNVLGQRAALQDRQEGERNEAEKLFWHDTGVMYNIPRHIYNMKHREYFGGLEQRHKEELATFDKMNLGRLPDGGLYTESHADENFAGMDDVRKKYRDMKTKHATQKVRALSDFFEGIPENLRETIKSLYKMKVIDVEDAQEEEIKQLFDKLTMTMDEEAAAEHEAIDDVPMHSLNPLKLNMLSEDMHVLNDAEQQYANKLMEEFGKNNKAVVNG